MGQGLALALGHAGVEVALLARHRRPLAAPLILHDGSWRDVARASEVVLVATPDDAISSAADALARQDAVGADQVVLHLSGLLDHHALAGLEPTGAGLGSFHPLQTIADPTTAPARLLGAYAGIEGDPRGEAVGEWLALALGMHAVRIRAEGKPAYHAGAVFAANFVVVLAGVAERLAVEAGVSPEVASQLYLPLLRGAAANLESGPAAALTGPVSRGDLATIRAHLSALGPADSRLYCQLGLAALALARRAGLPEESAEAVRRVLALDS
jgi:predicted short-subunit dehydrogenase-like oxidoreductase (DUF2520 family)